MWPNLQAAFCSKCFKSPPSLSWQTMPSHQVYGNAFKAQWELFLKHVAVDAPFPWTLLAGAKGVQLAELGLQSWQERRWVTVPALEAN